MAIASFHSFMVSGVCGCIGKLLIGILYGTCVAECAADNVSVASVVAVLIGYGVVVVGSLGVLVLNGFHQVVSRFSEQSAILQVFQPLNAQLFADTLGQQTVQVNFC